MVQVTKRAERSTRCTFCHSFASNIIVCFFPSFCVCVPARVCPRARTRVCAGAKGGYVRACVCVLGGGGAFVRGSERARARECVMCCFSIPNRSLHNASSAPFGESGKRPEKMMQPNAKVLSTSCRKTCHCRVLVRENSHKGQNGKATVFLLLFFLCDAVFLVSFLPCRTPPPDHVHESLPDHFRPCPQNTWAPYYTTARDWLKPKGVSALTDRSGVVY